MVDTDINGDFLPLFRIPPRSFHLAYAAYSWYSYCFLGKSKSVRLLKAVNLCYRGVIA